MHFSTSAAVLGLLATTVISSPTPATEDRLEKRGTFAITGITGTGTHPRLDIHTLRKNTNQWNLYLLTLQAWKSQSQSNPLSYYGVAGIHGVPNQPWDGVQENPNASGAVGYCTHSSILFPTWHRAYLALFEQEFYATMQTVVQSFPAGKQRQKYAKAASTFRIPYWDWAANPPKGDTTMPGILTQATVSVTSPQGQQTIQNPLLQYDFNPLDVNNFYYSPWNAWQTTLRYPTSTDSDATSQQGSATAALTNNAANLKSNVYNLFTQCTQYPEFSNDQSSASDSGCHNSLESIHDLIHTLVGGSNDGHMTYLWYAAFDPVFWLHHANVDRLFAMWQTLYPNTFTSAQTATATSFTIAVGDVEDQNSPLTPFHKDTNGDFFTSNDVRDWTTLHYTYPEFTDSNGSPAAIKKYVNQFYGPNGSKTQGSLAKRSTLKHPHTKAKREVPLNSTVNPDSLVVAPVAAPVSLISTPSGLRYQYTANIATQRFALDGSYSIFVFLGNFSSVASEWPFDPALVGTYGVFAQLGMSGMAGNHSVAGSVPLTYALTQAVEAGVLRDMAVDTVAEYLAQNMQWRVAASNGTEIPAAMVPGLQVSVVTANATVPASAEEFPVFGAWQTLTGITQGKAGGLQENEALMFDVAKEEARIRGYAGF